MHPLAPHGLSGQKIFQYSLLSLMILHSHALYAEESDAAPSTASMQQDIEKQIKTTAVLPTLKIEAMSELDPIKSYVDYDEANVTRNGLKKKIFPKRLIPLMFKNIKFMVQMT